MKAIRLRADPPSPNACQMIVLYCPGNIRVFDIVRMAAKTVFDSYMVMADSTMVEH